MFASWGDNITPPQQALNWIPDLYDSVDEIRLNEQTIVYCLHEKIGHLGIFVSAGVAKRETAELVERAGTDRHAAARACTKRSSRTRTPDMPGLEYVEGRYLIQFAPRTIDDILALDDGRTDEHAFEVVNRVSQINQELYDTFASPVVKALSNEPAARVMRETNQARAERWMFSDANPAMWWVKWMADSVRANRKPVSPDNPLLKTERDMSGRIEQALDQYRDARDEMSERMFKAIYESPWLAAAVGIDERSLGRRGPRAATWERDELQAHEAQGARGAHRAGHAARRLGAIAAVRRARGEGRRRAAVQPDAAPGQGTEAREHPVDGRAEGRREAAGLRAGAGRGTRDRRAAGPRARDGRPPPRL